MTYFNKEKDKNMGTVGKIAGGHKETVDSARNILKDGGNAFDAAVAISLYKRCGRRSYACM